MFRYDKDMERVMQKKKRDIINELTAYGNKLLQELSGVDKQTLTRLRQILDDYNRIEIELEAYGESLKPLINDVKALRETFKDEIEIIRKNDNFIVPEMFGATGDGVTDDTVALQLAINESSEKGIPLYFSQGKIYRVTVPLNFYNGDYKDVKLCIDGFTPTNSHVYVNENYGGIKLDNGVSLFKNATIKGSINRVSIIGVRESTKIFDNCHVSTFTLSNSLLANHGSVFYNSFLSSVSRITHNVFLSCAYFSQNENSDSCCTDSHIEYNYINGGKESTDNACFEWCYFNGSNVSNNFVDYYKVIYRPKSNKSFIYQGCTSVNNQYQVFRYFYNFDAPTGANFVSIGDTFNWTLETAESIQDVMTKYTKDTYTGKDGVTYEIPNYIGRPYQTGMISIINAKTENYIGDLLYIDGGSTSYNYSQFKCNFIGTNKYTNKIKYKEGDTKPIYNGGNACFNTWDIDLIETVESLPYINCGWSTSYNGRKVLYKNTICTATNVYDRTSETWSAKWLDPQGNEVT